MWIYLSLLVSIIGLLMYALAANAKLVEIGKMMFWTGLLAFLMTSAQHVVTTVVR